MPPKTPKTEAPVAAAPVAAEAPPVAVEPAPVLPAEPLTLIHAPCGIPQVPSEGGTAWAKANGKYLCARCGGPQPNWTFKWSNGDSFP